MSFNYPAPRLTNVDLYADGSFPELTTRNVMARIAGITVTLPPASEFQQGKIYSVINASDGTITVEAAPGELIYSGDQGTSSFEMPYIAKSQDFLRADNTWVLQ